MLLPCVSSETAARIRSSSGDSSWVRRASWAGRPSEKPWKCRKRERSLELGVRCLAGRRGDGSEAAVEEGLVGVGWGWDDQRAVVMIGEGSMLALRRIVDRIA